MVQIRNRAAATRVGITLALAAATLFLFWRNSLELAFVGDDAFIAFRYSRNLVDGLGLVWNPGERVEGFTSLSWVLIIATGLLIGLEPEALANAVGLLSGLSVLIALVFYCTRAFTRVSPLSLLAPLLLVLNRSFAGWSTGGLETQFFSLLVLLALMSFLLERERRGTATRSSYLFLAATLTRPEGLLFFLIAAVFLLTDVLRRRRSAGFLLRWSLPYLAVLSLVVLWKRVYFGYWLPNTFYAKVPGLWLEQGLRYLDVFADEYRIAWLAVPIVVLLLTRRCFEHWLLFAVISAYTVYVAAIGGDRFEFRFMVVLLPLLYWLFASSVDEIARSTRLSRFGRVVPVLAASSLALYGLFPGRMISATRVRTEVGLIGLEAIEDTGRFAEQQRSRTLQLLQLVDDGLLPADLRIGAQAVGVLPYYTGFYTVDIWGLNDEFVAHQRVPGTKIPAHRKAAPEWYLAERHLDMIEVENGFVRPFRSIADRARCAGTLRCVRAGPHLLLFETTLSEEEFAKRFALFELIH